MQTCQTVCTAPPYPQQYEFSGMVLSRWIYLDFGTENIIWSKQRFQNIDIELSPT